MEQSNYVFCKYAEIVILRMLRKIKIDEKIPNLTSKTIEYLKYRADLNFEADVRSKDAILVRL